MTRQAISPRLAIKILFMGVASEEQNFTWYYMYKNSQLIFTAAKDEKKNADLKFSCQMHLDLPLLLSFLNWFTVEENPKWIYELDITYNQDYM